MVISDGARDLMLKVLEEDGKNVIKVEIIKQGCHGQLYLDTIISNDFELINNVPIQISDVDREYLDSIIFDVRNGSLTFRVDGEVGCGGCHNDCSGGCEGCN